MKQKERPYLQTNTGLCSAWPTYAPCSCSVGLFLPGLINNSVSPSRRWICITYLYTHVTLFHSVPVAVGGSVDIRLSVRCHQGQCAIFLMFRPDQV